jgi:hypothetical protein
MHQLVLQLNMHFASLERNVLSRVLLFGGIHGRGVRQRADGHNAKADVPSRKGLSLARNVQLRRQAFG